MPRQSKPSSPRPVYSTGGSFQALAVESIESDSDQEPQPPIKPATNSNLNTPKSTPSSKKARAKQRARDRASKSTPTTETLQNSELPTPTPAPPKSDSKIENGTRLRSGKTVPSPHHLTPEPPQPVPTPTQELLQPPQPTSTSVATTNSSSVSPSTTDMEEEEEEEMDDDDEDDDEEEESATGSVSASKPLLTSQSKVDQKQTQSSQWVDVHHRKSVLNPLALPDTPVSTASTIRLPIIPSNEQRDEGHQQVHDLKSTEISTNTPTTTIDPSSQYGPDHNPTKKWQSVLTRVIWSLVMVGGFVGLMAMGHVYLIVLVFIIQFSVFREVTNLFQVGYKASAREHVKRQAMISSSSHHRPSAAAIERKRIKDVDNNRWSKVMSWYFFCAVNYFLYGESIIYYFKHIVFIDAYLLPFARHHRFISFLLYLIGFLAFVAKLDRGHLRRQFGLFSWIHMSLLLIVSSGQFMVNNILEGLIWFWVPASLVIMNDVAAYVFGMMFGRHQLIKLSPKKTVEGFVGGYFTTVIFAVLWGTLFMGWNYMICPVRDLGVTAFSPVECRPNDAFVWRSWEYQVGKPVIWWTPFQIHCIVLGTFAGLVAPFGGFFASGFKRAFGIKDFADTIPGHGGLTDRFDCQFLMGLFTHFYYTSLVREQHVTVGSVLEIIASSLNSSQQIELYEDLGKSLVSQGFKSLS